MIDLLDMNKHLERLAKHFSTCLAIPMPSCSNATGNFYELTRLTGYFVFVLRSMGWLVKSKINARSEPLSGSPFYIAMISVSQKPLVPIDPSDIV